MLIFFLCRQNWKSQNKVGKRCLTTTLLNICDLKFIKNIYRLDIKVESFRSNYFKQKHSGLMGGWKGGWMEAKTILRIA